MFSFECSFDFLLKNIYLCVGCLTYGHASKNVINALLLLFISESSVGTGAGCFPEGSIVYTEKGPRDIATLQKGDKVLAAADDGKMVYSEVRILS